MINFDSITEFDEPHGGWTVPAWDMYWLGLSPMDRETAEGVARIRRREGYKHVRVLPFIGHGCTAEMLHAFVSGNIRAMLFTELDNDEVPLDSCGYTAEDFSVEALDKIWHDCATFLSRVQGIIPATHMNNAGIDYHLTRQGHGSGFWDGDWDMLPDDGAAKLTAACGDGREEIYIEVDGMGKLHVRGGITEGEK